MAQIPQGFEGWLQQAIHHALSQPGKLLRPRLTLNAAASLGFAVEPLTVDDALVTLALIPELIHTATLLHDDVLDQADTRRGQPTVSAAFGNRMAILGGDWLLARASQLLAKLEHPGLVALYAEVLAELCQGETLQHMARYQPVVPTLADYEERLYGKTGSLFAAACVAPALWQASDEPTQKALRMYGRHLGLAFQWVDDWLDYEGDPAKTGKPVLDDLPQGLLNGPLVLALCDDQAPTSPKLEAAERDGLKQVSLALLEQAKHEQEAVTGDEAYQPTADLTAKMLELKAKLQALGVLEATTAHARWHSQQAIEALALCPTLSDTQTLQQLAYHAVERLA